MDHCSHTPQALLDAHLRKAFAANLSCFHKTLQRTKTRRVSNSLSMANSFLSKLAVVSHRNHYPRNSRREKRERGDQMASHRELACRKCAPGKGKPEPTGHRSRNSPRGAYAWDQFPPVGQGNLPDPQWGIESIRWPVRAMAIDATYRSGRNVKRVGRHESAVQV